MSALPRIPNCDNEDGPLRGIIRWTGGKTKSVRHLLVHVGTDPRAHRTLASPFLGAGAFELAVLRRYAPERLHLSDACRPLVALWSLIASGTTPATDPVDVAEFARLRGIHADEMTGEQFWRMLAVAYNGLSRWNGSGFANTPADQAKLDRRLRVPGHWQGVRRLLAGRLPQVRDWREAVADLERVPPGLLYLDPPYAGAFDGYGGGRVDVAELAAAARLLADLGWLVVANNSPQTAEAFQVAGAAVYAYEVRRDVAAKAERRGPQTEIVAVWR